MAKITKPSAAPASPGLTAQQEQDAASRAPTVTAGRSAPPSQVFAVPVTAEPITIGPKQLDPPAARSKFPRIRRVIFAQAMAFDSVRSVTDIDITLSEPGRFYDGLYKRLEFCDWMGGVWLLVERRASEGGQYWVFRIPLSACNGFAFFDDNEHLKIPVITVNEQAKPTLGAA